MDGAIYNRAVERIAQLQAELQRLETFVCTYRELAGAAEAAPLAQPNPARNMVAISPDGRNIVYTANQQIYLRRIGDMEARPIPGTRTRSTP